MIEARVAVKNQLGLHARAAARLVRTANRYQSSLRLERLDGTVSADAKSILNVLMLGATGGTELRAIAEGHDEAEALAALSGMFEDGFGELQP
ncbi:MAG TPA: HPr family phosphocarrier protein [Pyrinomonadaceae bacterium]|nr:HPr family phosphocarrier protein [Pyrinomonadaceae bacterium]